MAGPGNQETKEQSVSVSIRAALSAHWHDTDESPVQRESSAVLGSPPASHSGSTLTQDAEII